MSLKLQIISDMVSAMAANGCSSEQIAAVVRAVKGDDEQRKTDAERAKEYRERKKRKRIASRSSHASRDGRDERDASRDAPSQLRKDFLHDSILYMRRFMI